MALGGESCAVLAIGILILVTRRLVLELDGVGDTMIDSTMLVSRADSSVVLLASEVEAALVATTWPAAPASSTVAKAVNGTALEGVQQDRYEISTLSSVPE